MISQIVSVASWFVCWVVATRFGGLIAPTIPVEAPWNQVLAMAVVFGITMIAIQFARTALEKWIKHWHLQKLNTLLGGVLGFAKGLLLCMIITFFAVMFSETSRAVIFNSMTGFRLVRLITHISVFVPKDSYEFVHTQLAQFQDKVADAVPGQPPETLRIQGSDAVQQMLAQLQQTNEQPATSTASLWGALSKWWNGEKGETATATVTPVPPTQTVPKSESSPLPAVPYTPPLLPASPANTYASVPQQRNAIQPAVEVEQYFIKRPETNTSPLQPLVAPEMSAPQLPYSSSLPSLTPLDALPEWETQLLPTMPITDHVGSDLLLYNSRQTAKPNTAARVFRP